jgi:hypothetical protein
VEPMCRVARVASSSGGSCNIPGASGMSPCPVPVCRATRVAAEGRLSRPNLLCSPLSPLKWGAFLRDQGEWVIHRDTCRNWQGKG